MSVVWSAGRTEFREYVRADVRTLYDVVVLWRVAPVEAVAMVCRQLRRVADDLEREAGAGRETDLALLGQPMTDSGTGVRLFVNLLVDLRCMPTVSGGAIIERADPLCSRTQIGISSRLRHELDRLMRSWQPDARGAVVSERFAAVDEEVENLRDRTWRVYMLAHQMARHLASVTRDKEDEEEVAA